MLLGAPNVAMADAEYSDANATVTHDCGTDATVTFDNASSVITVIGECDTVAINGASSKVSIVSAKKVVVSGASNEKMVDAADKISITGSSNIVWYIKGLDTAKSPKIAKTGVSNKVAKRKVVKAK